VPDMAYLLDAGGVPCNKFRLKRRRCHSTKGEAGLAWTAKQIRSGLYPTKPPNCYFCWIEH